MNLLRRLAKELIAAWIRHDPTLQADALHFTALDSGIGRRVTITIHIEDDAPQHPLPVLETAVSV